MTSGLDADTDHRTCDRDLTRAFELLGKRWNGIILATLAGEPAGFAELRRAVGSITDSVLSDRLTELGEAGLVTRTVTATRPPGVSYELTGAGKALLPVLDQLATWSADNLPARCPGTPC
jgi:DNA-binding HxlR family transcriptional regulator